MARSRPSCSPWVGGGIRSTKVGGCRQQCCRCSSSNWKTLGRYGTGDEGSAVQVVAIHGYKAVTFNIYPDQTDPGDGPAPSYYYWERDDLAEQAVGRCSFLPMDTIEDAESEVDGGNVHMWITAKEDRGLQ